MKITIYTTGPANGKKYPYGTFDYDTTPEKEFVGLIVKRLKKERGCEVELRNNNKKKIRDANDYFNARRARK